MDVDLPQLAEGVDSGTVVNLLVAVGDRVTEGQPIVELETEKAVGTVPSPAAGTVSKIYVSTGQQLSVGQAIMALAETEAEPKAPTSAPSKPADARDAPKPVAEPQPAVEPKQPKPAAEPPPAHREASKAGVEPPAAPSLRNVAHRLGIDLTRVKGSARGGRITLEDMRAYIQDLQRRAVEPPLPQVPAAKPAKPPADFAQWGPIRREPMSSVRRTISQRMTEAWTTIPHVTQFDEADITNLLEMRARYHDRYKAQGVELTLTVFLIKAALALLTHEPMFNASLDDRAGEIIFKDYYHVGIAVDTEAGLMVPVIRDADRKNLLELSRPLHDLAQRARERHIGVEELRGGTFTISNQGGIGGGHFTPIIRAPEVALLGAGRGMARPVVRDHAIEARSMLPLSLSYDHRLIDGADAARGLRQIAQALEAFDEQEVRGPVAA